MTTARDRIERWLEAKKEDRQSHPDIAHSYWVHKENEPRQLLVADLEELLATQDA